VTQPPSPPADFAATLPLEQDALGGLSTAIVDAKGKVRAVSGSFASALRIRRDELLSRSLPLLVRVADRPALTHAINAVAVGDWPRCSLEVGFLQHGREERAVRLVLEADEEMRVRLYAADLTAEREASRTLAEYQESLRALTAHALDIWALLDANGTMRSVSASVSVHLGWSAEDLEGRMLPDFVHPDDIERIAELLGDLQRDPSRVRSAVLRARHRDGGWRTLETTTSGFNPAVLGNSVFVVNARDVTARERTEAALREVEYRFSQLVEQALTGIVVVQRGRLVYANPRFLQLVGLGPEALASRPRALGLIERRSIATLREVRAAIATGAQHTARIHLRGQHALGHPIEVDVATSVVDFSGSPALLCTVTDMTEARLLQQRMAEAEKIEAVGLLAGGVAHDFNNMLTGILAWVDIAADELGPGHPVGQALDEIKSSAERGAELTRQLLAFGRRQFLERRPLDLGETVVRLKRWMDRVLGPDHPLEVTVPDAPWLIEADRSQIERALTALIMNARDAMPHGGVIKVDVRNETLTEDHATSLGALRAGAHVVVRVRDRGVGMDEPTRRRIFEPFFTTKPQGQGSGLGLPAVLGTVLQSGGALDVESAVDAGTEFRCYFPRLVPPAAGDATDAHPAATASVRTGRQILVVEDDPQLGSVLRRLLHEGGHQVRLATNASEAEAMAIAVRPDVLVCDVGLPGARGSALAGALCARGAAGGTVLISGREITGDEVDEAGPNTIVLLKPFRPQRLLQAVDEVARGTARGAVRDQ
jgi:two-component system, cell cycle sensor histidine kinase and response regulator CckA